MRLFFVLWRLALNEKTPLFLPPLIRKKRKRREKISFRERQMPPPETLKQIVIFRRFEDQWDCKWTPAMRNKKESCLHPKATLFIYLQLGGSLLRWGRSVHLYSAGLGVWTWIDLKNRLLWFFVSQQYKQALNMVSWTQVYWLFLISQSLRRSIVKANEDA